MRMGRHAALCSAAQQKYFWRCGFAASFTWPKTVASQDLLFEAISADDIVKNEFVSSHLNSLHLVERPLTFIKAPPSLRGVIDVKVFNKNSLSYYQMWSETKSVHWTQLFFVRSDILNQYSYGTQKLNICHFISWTSFSPWLIRRSVFLQRETIRLRARLTCRLREPSRSRLVAETQNSIWARRSHQISVCLSLPQSRWLFGCSPTPRSLSNTQFHNMYKALNALTL